MTRKPRLDDDHYEWIHEETAHSAQGWYYCAETLVASALYLKGGLESGPAAKRLADHGYMDSHYNSFGLLLGYALENIFKGLWVAEGGTLIEEGKLVGIPGAADHDLLQLAARAQVPLVGDDRMIVDRLSYFVRVAGRYPVPKNPADLRPRDVPGRGVVDRGFFSHEDWDIAANLTNRLLDELRDRMY